MTSSSRIFFLLLLIVVCGVTATWNQGEQKHSECAEGGCEEESNNNKFALLFQQMLARQRETDTDCQIVEDCSEGFGCIGGKCRSMGPRRTKMINLYSRW